MIGTLLNRESLGFGGMATISPAVRRASQITSAISLPVRSKSLRASINRCTVGSGEIVITNPPR